MKKRIQNLWSDYRSDRNGNMAVLTGVSLGIFMACGAAAADVSMWQSQQNKLQDAADSAALSGAIMLSNGAQSVDDDHQGDDDEDEGGLRTQVKIAAKALVHGENNTTLPGYKSDVHVNPRTETVTVNLSVDVPRMFASMFMKDDPTVRVLAEATVVHRKDVNCLYLMDPTSDRTLKLAGSGSLNAPGCGIQVHSTSPTAVTNASLGNLVSDKICVAGSYSGSGYQPTPQSNCAADPDPFENLGIPAGGGCDHNSYVATGSGTLYPGTYCGGLRADTDFNMHLAPGIYFIRGGKLKLTSNASITGDGVVFVLQGDASLDVNSSGKFVTTPPTRGPLKGFSIVQSDDAVLGDKSTISGHGNIHFGGTIYAPKQIFELTGKSDGNSHTPGYGAIIAYQLKIAGQGALNISNNDDGAKIKETVRLVR